MHVNPRSISQRIAVLSIIVAGTLSLTACDGDGGESPTQSASVGPSESSEGELMMSLTETLEGFLTTIGDQYESRVVDEKALASWTTRDLAARWAESIQRTFDDGVFPRGTATVKSLQLPDDRSTSLSSFFACIDNSQVELFNADRTPIERPVSESLLSWEVKYMRGGDEILLTEIESIGGAEALPCS